MVARDITTPGSEAFSLWGSGDVLPDGSTITNVSQIDVSSNGRLATYGREVAMDGSTRTVYRIDGVLALEDGDAAPLAGATYDIPTAVQIGVGLAVSNSERLGVLGNVDSPASSAIILASGDDLITEVGQPPVGSGGLAINDVAGGTLDMTEDDRIVWVARDENLEYGAYLDGERLIFPGQAVAGSTLVDAGVSAFTFYSSPLSTSGGFMTEVVELADGRRGLWVVQRDIGESLSCGTVAHSGGQVGTIQATGSDLAGGNPLTLVAADLPAQTFGIFITSRVFDANGMAVTFR